MTFREQKAAIRNDVLALRDGLAETDRIEKSLAAAELGADRIAFEPGTIVSAFLPIRSEIDARPLMDRLRQRGARLSLPVVIDRETIVFRELVRGVGLVDTGFGTSGPPQDAQVLDPQVLVMPLSVFDRGGNRIGYGAGHYDRAIGRLMVKGIEPLLIGLAFDCQEVASVPFEPHDVPLNAIVTESGYRSF